MRNKGSKSWSWVPSLYFAEGLPYVLVMEVSVIMYKNLGLSNLEIALYTSWLYLPWVIKPLWSPVVDVLKTKRWWVTVTQSLIAVCLAGLAYFIPSSYFVQSTLAMFWLIAFASATHDVAADGFYMIALTEEKQSFFVGIRNTFYRIALVTGQGLVVMLAGLLANKHGGDFSFAWSFVFFAVAALFGVIAVYHAVVLPKVEERREDKDALVKTSDLFVSFFKKKNIVVALFFILLFRLGEGQLGKMAKTFLLDSQGEGGLGLTTEDSGLIYGTCGTIALLLGGIIGGIAVSLHGLKRWILVMALAMNVPDLIYVFFSMFQPDNIWLIAGGVVLEQFGYGFGYTAFTLYLIYFSQGEYKTGHYALCTGLMAMGMMLAGLVSGYAQEWLGYELFFIWVCVCTIPGIILIKYLDIPEGFGRKAEHPEQK